MSIACKVRPIGGEALLPDGYRRCEYLESTGTQYINTEVSINNDSEVNCTFESRSSEYSLHEAIFGTRTSYTNGITLFYPGITSDKGSLIFTREVYVPAEFGKKLSAKLNKTELKCGDMQYSNNGSITGEIADMLLFCVNTKADGGVPYYFSKARIYSFSISSNNQLQINFIPCLDDKGKPCMFDTVSRTPYYNKGTGDFIYKLKAPITRKLPRGYQPLDYLESNGTQYIDTGITATKDTGLYAEWMFNGQGGNQNQHVLSCLNLYCPRPRKVDNVWVAQGTLGSGPATNFELTFGKKNIASTNFQNSRTINFNETSVMVSEVSGSIQDKVILYGYSDLSNGYLFYGRVYSAKISKGTEIVRDFVPCLDPTGKPCMWDYVTRRPFYNQNTTGTDFLYG